MTDGPSSDLLATWLAAEEARPFEGFWGRQDCILFFCDWVRARSGVDPAQGLRGRYGSCRGALRIVTAAGGMTALVDGRLGAVGWSPRRIARRGHVGLVEVLPWGSATKALRSAAGVCLGGGWWAGRSETGELIVARARPLAVWGPDRRRGDACPRQ